MRSSSRSGKGLWSIWVKKTQVMRIFSALQDSEGKSHGGQAEMGETWMAAGTIRGKSPLKSARA